MLNDPKKGPVPKLKPLSTPKAEPEATAEPAAAEDTWEGAVARSASESAEGAPARLPVTRTFPMHMPKIGRIDVAPIPRLPMFAAIAQGFYCTVIGLWAVIGFNSLMTVTGQKTDHWAVALAGLLLAGIGLSLLTAAVRRDIAVEVYGLGVMAALGMAMTDAVFVIERSIPAVYLLDAVAELLFVTLWVFAIRAAWNARGVSRRGARLPVNPFPPQANAGTTETGGIDAPE